MPGNDRQLGAFPSLTPCGRRAVIILQCSNWDSAGTRRIAVRAKRLILLYLIQSLTLFRSRFTAILRRTPVARFPDKSEFQRHWTCFRVITVRKR